MAGDDTYKNWSLDGFVNMAVQTTKQSGERFGVN